ncbi:RDD family protein (plasmid) [Coraliomargarita sp. W4R53]
MIWEIDESTKQVEGLDAAGRPMPAYAASLGLIAAPFGRRFAATTVEVAVVFILALPVLLGALPIALANLSAMDAAPVALSGSDLIWFVVFAAATSVLTTVFVIVQMTLHGRRGVTLGKAFFGIRSVNVRTLERPGFWRGAVVRYLVMWASFLVPFFGPLLVVCLSPLFDSEHRGRGWPDHAGATWFVDIRNGLNPYDAKRMRIARKTVATNLLDEKTPLPSLATSSSPSAPAGYVVATRSNSGVLGAHRVESQVSKAQPPISAPAKGVPVTVAAAPFGAPAVSPAAAPVLPRSDAVAPPLQPSSVASKARDASGLISVVPGARPRGIEVSMRLDDGTTVQVSGSGVLIGRDPSMANGEHGLSLLKVTDEGKSVSKTHVGLFLSDASLTVVDRGSTNGSTVVRAGEERTLIAGESVEVEDGDTITFGDRSAVVRIA